MLLIKKIHTYNHNLSQIYQNEGMVEEEIFVNPDQVQTISLIAPWCFQAS